MIIIGHAHNEWAFYGIDMRQILLLIFCFSSGATNAAYVMRHEANGLVDPKNASQNASSSYTIGVDGWKWFADYDGDVIGDEKWIEYRKSMKEGVKIVFGNGHFAFINKQKLLSASCQPIDQVDSLSVAHGRIAWSEVDCNSQGMDYAQIFIRNYSPVYNYVDWFDYASFKEKEYGKQHGAKFYIR